MPIRRLPDDDPRAKEYGPPCLSTEHNPPSHMVLQPGTYEYICPSCGRKTVFHVYGSYCSTVIAP
jgi:hypothetical protein